MIKVIKAGLLTSIQDAGRKDWRQIGVPISGCMDMHSAQLANLILGNDSYAPVIEVTLMGPKLEFEEAASISICGADLEAKLNDIRIDLNTVIQIQKEDVLSFGAPTNGARSYIAIAGGFEAEEILRSRSWCKGVTEEFKLYGGEELKFKTGIQVQNIHHNMSPIDLDEDVLVAHKGPEYDSLSEEQISALSQIFTIGVNDRMGYRLNEEIENDFESMLSSPVLPGTVQLTPSGKMIILMRDCQTTGGYPRILQLTDDAINLLAQKGMGEEIRFQISQ